MQCSSGRPRRTSESDAVAIITQEGAMYYNDAHIVDRQTLLIALLRTLQLRPGLRIAIQADKSAQQGRVVEVMNTAKAIGIERVAIVTVPMRTSQ